jgi:hypothetical protein
MDPVRWTDKVNALSTLVAATVAVFVPIAAFFWLNPAVQDATLRKQLLVSEQSRRTCEFCGGDSASPEIDWTVSNPGQLYADDVVIAVRSTNPNEARTLKLCDGDDPEPDFCIKLSSEYLADAWPDKWMLTLKLKAPIPPLSAMHVLFFVTSKEFDDRNIQLTVNSKNGPAQVLSGGGGGNI